VTGERDARGRPVALVTGAARGIGAAIARALAVDHDIVVHHRTSGAAAGALVDELRRGGGRAEAIAADVADEAEVEALFARIDERMGRLDVLVNNAGTAAGHGGIDRVTGASLAALWAVNVTGPFLCAREAVRRMSTASGGRGGCIVNISSKAAVLGGAGEWVDYAASKGALDTMTVGLARELAPAGIRVNAVRPGLIVTEFHRHAPTGRVEAMAPAVPMQRAGSAAEVADAVRWLVSPGASYVAGALVDVTGGR